MLLIFKLHEPEDKNRGPVGLFPPAFISLCLSSPSLAPSPAILWQNPKIFFLWLAGLLNWSKKTTSMQIRCKCFLSALGPSALDVSDDCSDHSICFSNNTDMWLFSSPVKYLSFKFSLHTISHFSLLCPIGFQLYDHHPDPSLFSLASPVLVPFPINTSALPANTAASTLSLLHLITAAPSQLASPGWRFLDPIFIHYHCLILSYVPKSSTAALNPQTLFSLITIPWSCFRLCALHLASCIFLVPLFFLQHCPFSPQIAALLVCHWKQTSCGSLSHQLLISSNLKCNLKSLYFLQTINFSLLTLL